jgi:hypothetical protein
VCTRATKRVKWSDKRIRNGDESPSETQDNHGKRTSGKWSVSVLGIGGSDVRTGVFRRCEFPLSSDSVVQALRDKVSDLSGAQTCRQHQAYRVDHKLTMPVRIEADKGSELRHPLHAMRCWATSRRSEHQTFEEERDGKKSTASTWMHQQSREHNQHITRATMI